MERPKPPRVPKEYEEGPKAARQFDALLGRVLTVPHEEVKKRHAAWEHSRKGQRFWEVSQADLLAPRNVYSIQKSAVPHQDHLEEYKVSPKTIERDGRFAEAVDTLVSGLHPVAQVPGLAVS